MIIYKQITVNNCKQFEGLPANVMVLDGGTMSWPRGQRRVGIIVNRAGVGCKIVWMNGQESGYYDRVSDMVISMHLHTSFFYVEIKNQKYDGSAD